MHGQAASELLVGALWELPGLALGWARLGSWTEGLRFATFAPVAHSGGVQACCWASRQPGGL